MKRPATLFLLGAFTFGSVAFAESAPALEVHEWGTFTVVCGSDGQPIRWYQPRKTLAELPAFVIPQGLSVNSTVPSENQLTKSGNRTLTLSPAANADTRDPTDLPAFVLPQDQVHPANVRGIVVAGKTGTATSSASHGFFVRMETPVIYFYSQSAMHVSVDVTMKQGHITEWFPQSAGSGANGVMHWDGALASPADPAAARLLPVDLAHGARYARARSVPNAWFFHTAAGPAATPVEQERAEKTEGWVSHTPIPAAATPVADATARPSAPEAWEKFIFYRGAGDELPPYRVEAPGASVVHLSHSGDGAGIQAAFFLEIGSRGARWARIIPLPAMTGDAVEPFVKGYLNSAVNPLLAVQEELAAAIRAALTEAGLTTDEARAMVATWGDVWFSETGTRVLAILPRAWVDATLPLTVNPAPSKLTRVFVARFEVFTPEREQALLNLLTAEDRPSAETLEKFRSLRLDRFATAALERARRLADERMRAVFTDLQAAEKKPAAK